MQSSVTAILTLWIPLERLHWDKKTRKLTQSLISPFLDAINSFSSLNILCRCRWTWYQNSLLLQTKNDKRKFLRLKTRIEKKKIDFLFYSAKIAYRSDAHVNHRNYKSLNEEFQHLFSNTLTIFKQEFVSRAVCCYSANCRNIVHMFRQFALLQHTALLTFSKKAEKGKVILQ